MTRAGTPAPIIDKLHNTIVAYIGSPEGQKKLIDMGMVPGAPTKPAELQSFVKDEVRDWG
jgi:tripartite-type tricarboxylate transporter receptor subunit TctC